MAKAAARKGQKRTAGRKQAKGGMWPWYLAGILSVGTVFAYEHRADLLPMTPPLHTASIAKFRPAEPQAETLPERRKPALALPTPGVRPYTQPDERSVEQAALTPPADLSDAARKPGSFYFCTQNFENCVVDGGTFWYGRQKVRLSGIETPRIKEAKCDNERKLGSLAKRRLWQVLNGGEVRLASAGIGKSASASAVVTVGQGRSVSDILVAEGLALPSSGGKRGWCAG
ncbi:thermonuclease family protein [Pararhizobium gei]|uniref:thermonuclease family protein n=1 Tax=Pararhizobium gei TaxID=1395951 RepID=UPI0023DB6137|nr:thermonuclease family protein [Rhizobium gei]